MYAFITQPLGIGSIGAGIGFSIGDTDTIPIPLVSADTEYWYRSKPSRQYTIHLEMQFSQINKWIMVTHWHIYVQLWSHFQVRPAHRLGRWCTMLGKILNQWF